MFKKLSLSLAVGLLALFGVASVPASATSGSASTSGDVNALVTCAAGNICWFPDAHFVGASTPDPPPLPTIGACRSVPTKDPVTNLKVPAESVINNTAPSTGFVVALFTDNMCTIKVDTPAAAVVPPEYSAQKIDHSTAGGATFYMLTKVV